MKWRIAVLLVFSSLFTAVCVYLAFWQLSRHSERKSFVRSYAQNYASPPVDFERASADSAGDRGGRVIVAGRYDLAHEIIVANRTRRGAPGVVIVTPLLREGNDTAVLVSRGWVYSADGSSVDLAAWRKGIAIFDSMRSLSEPVTILGLAVDYGDSAGARTLSRDSSGAVARVSRLTLAHASKVLPYPVEKRYVQLLPVDTVAHVGIPVPLPPPTLSAGSHLSYAIQWFAFAAIAVIGTTVFLRRQE